MFNTATTINDKITLRYDSDVKTRIRAIANISSHYREVEETPEGRIICSSTDFRTLVETRYLILNETDRQLSRESRRSLLRQHDCYFELNPYANGEQAYRLIDKLLLPSVRMKEGRTLIGTWEVRSEGIQMPYSWHTETEIYLPFSFTGRDLLTVASDGFLQMHGFLNEVFFYLDDRFNKIRHITLNRRQYNQLVKGSEIELARLHRRLIWFPSLSKYAHDTGKIPADVLAQKEDMTRRETRRRRDMLDKELLQWVYENPSYVKWGIERLNVR